MRGKKAIKRKIKPDIEYNNTHVAKFINYIMEQGKKTVAQNILYDSFKIIEEKTKNDPFKVFDEAVKNVTPLIEVRGRRVGGGNYQIPYPVKGVRRFFLASKWILNAARARKGKAMREKLALELIDASKGEGAAIKKRSDVQKMAEANRAFAHFARH